jgi:hypothetical protein
MRKLCGTFYLLLACGLHGQNAVTDWAKIVQPVVDTSAPPYVFVLGATIQLAVYDAAIAIEGGFRPFAAAIPAPRGASVGAAVATAAWRTARGRVDPSQFPYLDTQYTLYLAGIPGGQAKTDGVRVGESAAAAILALRANDGVSSVVVYECSAVPPPPGEFEPDAGCGSQPVAANAGRIKPFTFSVPSRFRPHGPNPLRSGAYAEDFHETRDYGRSNSIVRTPEQTDIAYFWQAVEIHQGFINLAIRHGLSVRDAARFFAMVYTAGADSAIAGFEAKYFYRSWRPRTAIPRADTDRNPDTEPDPAWTPLITVNHPEYPSAHAFITTANAEAIARFFGSSRIEFRLTADKAFIPQLVRTERTYDNLSTMLRELYNARVWAGLHWRDSMQDGAHIGRKVAEHVCTRFFRPERGDESEDDGRR